VRTSLIREARDWTSMVVGPSKRRNNCAQLLAFCGRAGVGIMKLTLSPQTVLRSHVLRV
jgi:hypothetical protein